jgi:hypothetical protein
MRTHTHNHTYTHSFYLQAQHVSRGSSQQPVHDIAWCGVVGTVHEGFDAALLIERVYRHVAKPARVETSAALLLPPLYNASTGMAWTLDPAHDTKDGLCFGRRLNRSEKKAVG